MEEIKDLFVKHFGFYPDIISTTEHVYLSPPSRIISSLIELSKFSNKKILRIAMTDTYAIPPEQSIRQICLPHILNKNIFLIDVNQSKKELIEKFNENDNLIKNILNKKLIFSLKEKSSYTDLINLYSKVFENLENIDSVNLYNDVIKTYIYNLNLKNLYEWLCNNNIFGIDSKKLRVFLKEAFEILCKVDPMGIDSIGKYLETKKRLKVKDENDFIQIISWQQYLNELKSISSSCNIVSEIILYVYSYCGGSHFGNDYGVTGDINEIQNSNNLFQITEHNKDFSFKITEENIEFHQVNIMKNNLNLSQKMYKTIETLPELYVVLGRDDLINKISDLKKLSK